MRFLSQRARGATLLAALLSLLGGVTVGAQSPTPPRTFVQFSGTNSYVEVPDSPDLSVATTGSLTISAWIKPDTLTFANTEGSGYVYWAGKGTRGQDEWALRMYSQNNQENRANRISFYVFNPAGGLGIGSYFEDPVTPGEWIHVVATADGRRTRIYKNGALRHCDQYTGNDDRQCNHYAQDMWITPQHGNMPMRLGTRDLHSFFQGSLGEVRIWNRALGADEIATLYSKDTPPRPGLVAEYLLSEGSGSMAHDSAGAYDAMLHTVTWSTSITQVTAGPETVAGTGQPISYTPGQSFSEPVAAFTDTDLSVTPDLLQVSIDWADGTALDLTSAVITGGNGTFQITASHTYPDAGPYTVQVTATNTATQAQGSAQSTASAAALPATPLGAFSITTFAGGGTPADGLGDNGPATKAQLTGPSGVAVDGVGNVYVVDRGMYRVRRIDSQGTIKTYAGNGTNDNKCGGGPATQVGFDSPLGVAADGAGHVFVTDYLCGTVSRIEPDPNPGNLLTVVAGSLCLGVGMQGCLFGLAEQNGQPADLPATQTELPQPAGVAVATDQTGSTLYVAQPAYNLVRVVKPQGTLGPFAGQWDGQPTVLNGVAGYAPDGTKAALAALNTPAGVAVGTHGEVFIADTLNSVVRKVDPSGVITTVAGGGSPADGIGDEGPATGAALSQPNGVAVDGGGTLYIADTVNNLVRSVDPQGVIHTIAGTYASPGYTGDGGPATAAQLDGPVAVALFDAGRVPNRPSPCLEPLPNTPVKPCDLRIYIVDSSNNVVRVLQTSH